MKRIVAAVLVPSLSLLAAGCSVKSKAPNAYHLAQQACNSTGQAALSYAEQAAKLDPQHFGQLAADEAALVTNVNAQQSGAPGGDLGDLAGVTGQEGTGQGSSYQVLLDCKNISLQLLPGQ
ncbi:MAG TPA: hypothetical protein VHE56_00020 [Mycobacteriales bacterium]|nr:hypothetical protein [Mycobacteriales bacterium]